MLTRAPLSASDARVRPGRGVAMSWDDLIEMFNPGHKHLADERDRKRIEAQIPGSEADDDPYAAVADLERGIIFLPKAEEHPEDESSP